MNDLWRLAWNFCANSTRDFKILKSQVELALKFSCQFDLGLENLQVPSRIGIEIFVPIRLGTWKSSSPESTWHEIFVPIRLGTSRFWSPESNWHWNFRANSTWDLKIFNLRYSPALQPCVIAPRYSPAEWIRAIPDWLTRNFEHRHIWMSAVETYRKNVEF